MDVGEVDEMVCVIVILLFVNGDVDEKVEKLKMMWCILICWVGVFYGVVLYWLFDDGSICKIWLVDWEMFFVLVVMMDGALLVVIGDFGCVYCMDEWGWLMMLFQIFFD